MLKERGSIELVGCIKGGVGYRAQHILGQLTPFRENQQDGQLGNKMSEPRFHKGNLICTCRKRVVFKNTLREVRRECKAD